MVRHLHGNRRNQALSTHCIDEPARAGHRREQAEAGVPEVPEIARRDRGRHPDDEVGMGRKRGMRRPVVLVQGEDGERRLFWTKLERTVEDEDARITCGVIDRLLARRRDDDLRDAVERARAYERFVADVGETIGR